MMSNLHSDFIIIFHHKYMFVNDRDFIFLSVVYFKLIILLMLLIILFILTIALRNLQSITNYYG